MTHTPGPWEVERGSSSGAVWITSTANIFIGGNAEANTLLIAAAPELLEALEFMVAHNPVVFADAEREIYAKARAAIAKAKGETL